MNTLERHVGQDILDVGIFSKTGNILMSPGPFSGGWLLSSQPGTILGYDSFRKTFSLRLSAPLCETLSYFASDAAMIADKFVSTAPGAKIG